MKIRLETGVGAIVRCEEIPDYHVVPAVIATSVATYVVAGRDEGYIIYREAFTHWIADRPEQIRIDLTEIPPTKNIDSPIAESTNIVV